MRQYLPYPCHSLFLVFTLIFCSGPGANYCLSQERPDPFGDATSETSSEEDEESWKISFPGGTVEEYLKAIRDTAPKKYYPDINVVVVESASGFELPRIEATTTLDGFLGCLEACSTSRHRVEISLDDRTEKIKIIRVVALDEPSNTRGVYNVQRILKKVSKEDLNQAISIALEFYGKAEGIEMKLHEETGLLFFKGPQEGREAIEETLTELFEQDVVTSNYNNQNPAYGLVPPFYSEQRGLPNAFVPQTGPPVVPGSVSPPHFPGLPVPFVPQQPPGQTFDDTHSGQKPGIVDPGKKQGGGSSFDGRGGTVYPDQLQNKGPDGGSWPPR